jgi:hypothetical protein
LAAVCFCRVTFAAAPTAHLLYAREAGAQSCPEESALRAEVAARLGRDPFAAQAPTTVSVFLSGKPQALRARIELSDPHGEVTGNRDLTSRNPNCTELFNAVALAVSLAIDPLSFADIPAPRTSTTPQPKPPDPNLNLNVHVNLNQEPKLRFRLGAGALASLGSAPNVTFGFTVMAGLRGPRWSTNLELRADLPSLPALAAGGHIDTALYTANLIPCFHQGVFAGCAILALGGQVSHGTDYPVSLEASNFFAAGGVRAALEFKLARRFELQVRADLLAAFTRTTLYADQVAVFRTPPVSGAFAVAGIGDFP